MRKGGGLRAQLAKADAAHRGLISDAPRYVEDAPVQESALVAELLHQWGEGEVSALAVQKLSLLAILDGAKNTELAEVAAMGTVGKWPANVSRELKQKFCKDMVFPCASLVSTYFRDPKISKTVLEDMAIVRPDHLVHALSKLPAEFDCFFGTSKLNVFWSQVEASGDPKLVDHPLTLLENWRDRVIPLWFHGDGVEFSERDSLQVFSFGAVTSLLSSLDSSALLAAAAKTCTVDETAACPGDHQFYNTKQKIT